MLEGVCCWNVSHDRHRPNRRHDYKFTGQRERTRRKAKNECVRCAFIRDGDARHMGCRQNTREIDFSMSPGDTQWIHYGLNRLNAKLTAPKSSYWLKTLAILLFCVYLTFNVIKFVEYLFRRRSFPSFAIYINDFFGWSEIIVCKLNHKWVLSVPLPHLLLFLRPLSFPVSLSAVFIVLDIRHF